MFADDRLVGRNTHAGVGLDDPAYLIDFFLVDSGRAFELVVYHGQYARKRGISGTFTQSVDCTVYTLYAGFYGRVDICYG